MWNASELLTRPFPVAQTRMRHALRPTKRKGYRYVNAACIRFSARYQHQRDVRHVCSRPAHLLRTDACVVAGSGVVRRYRFCTVRVYGCRRAWSVAGHSAFAAGPVFFRCIANRRLRACQHLAYPSARTFNCPSLSSTFAALVGYARHALSGRSQSKCASAPAHGGAYGVLECL